MEDEEIVVKRESSFPLFSKSFITHPLDVVEYGHTVRKQMQDFIDAFKKRIQIEVYYSKQLAQVSKALDKYIKPGTELSSSFICSAFKVEHEQRSRQAFELSQALKTQIETMCSEMVKTHTASQKKMASDVKSYYKQGQKLQSNHGYNMQKFNSISKQMQQTIITKNITRYTTGIPQQKRLKLIGRATQSIKDNKQYEKLYIAAVKDYNLFVQNYNNKVKKQLDQIQTQFRQQLSMQGDCLRKLIVAQVSMFKNIQYDLLNISKQMQHLDTQRDVQLFYDQHKDNMNNRIVPISVQKIQQNRKVLRRKSSQGSMESMPCDELEKKNILGKSMLNQSLLNVDEDYFSWMLHNKKNKKLLDIISRVWESYKDVEEKSKSEQPVQQNGAQKKQETQEESAVQPKHDEKEEIQGSKQAENTWQDQLRSFLQTLKLQQPPNIHAPSQRKGQTIKPQELEEAFKDITSSIALLWNRQVSNYNLIEEQLSILSKHINRHHICRLFAYLFIKQYRRHHEVTISSWEEARLCGRVVNCILNTATRERDVFIVRGILGLVFTFYWNDEKTKKLLYLCPDIFQCQIWRRNQFWQAAIFQKTYQAMAGFPLQKNETQAQTTLRQKNMIFSHLASFCHNMVMLGISSKNVRIIVGRYCRLYDMSEQQNKDLSKMITNTSKAFKENNRMNISDNRSEVSLPD